MQQKMLSDQPLRQERQAKRKRNKNDGFCALGLCFYAVVFWRPVRRLLCVGAAWLAAIPLLSHFCSCSSAMLPQALLLTDRREIA